VRHILTHALVADAHALSAFGISDIIQHLIGHSEVKLGECFDDLVAALSSDITFDIITVDLSLPGMDRLRGLRALREICGTTRLVVVASESDRATVLAALSAGVHGYVTKDMSAKDIAEAFRLVLAGHIFVPKCLSDIQIPDSEEKFSVRFQRDKLLTLRQRDVMKHLRNGASNKEIARALGISESTVKVHMAAAFRLLGVHNRVSAVTALDGPTNEQRELYRAKQGADRRRVSDWFDGPISATG
jgi:DNA-binding NarL/FixJ family response regulator